MPQAHLHLDTDHHEAAEIMADHEQMTRALAKLVSTREASEIVTLLGELRGLLETHFAREERADGILRDVRDNAPNRVDEMARILAEHDAFLATIEQLEGDARGGFDGPMDGLFKGLEQLKVDLLDHEARESEIFLDALYTDIGTQD